jgi:STE24 endopeptidase
VPEVVPDDNKLAFFVYVGHPEDVKIDSPFPMDNVVDSATTPPDLGRAYAKQLRWVGELRFLSFFLAILAYALLGAHKWSASLAQAATNNFYLQIVICWIPLWIVCALANLPVSLYRFRLEHKFQMAKSGLQAWLKDFFKVNTLQFGYGAAIIEIAFVSTTLFPAYGWILAGILCSFLFMAVIRSAPWLLSLFYPVLPLNNKPLQERLTRLASKAGVHAGTIYDWRISERTRAANALVTGIGSARRILLTDTLLSGLSEDEIEAIMAHELGHCALHHIRAKLALHAAIFTAIFGVINFAVLHDLVCFIDDNRGWHDLRLLPGSFLYWNCAYIYGNMFLSALSRRQEKAADLYSWTLIGRAGPFITAMRKFTALNLIVFDKNSEWKYMHPPTADRIAVAEEYAKAHGETITAAASAGATSSVGD